MDIKYLKGVGENRANLLKKLGIQTISDLLEFFPRDYINRKSGSKIKDLELEQRYSLVGEIASVEKKGYGKGRSQLHVVITDGTDYLFCTWFKFPKWLLNKFEVGDKIWVSGFVTSFAGSKQILHPEFEILKSKKQTDNFWHSRDVLPIYALTEGLNVNTMRKLIFTAFKLYHNRIEETLPERIIKEYGFSPRKIALQKIHFGQDLNVISKEKKRFAFEELLYHQIMLARCKKKHNQIKQGISFVLKKTFTTRLKNSLEFELTVAQKKVIREIVDDMTSPKQMNRLLQGDVGSGKTIVTLFAMLLALENGYQAVLMAPTEILAEQHYHNIVKMLKNQPEINITLLKGGNYKGKKKIKEQIESGQIEIIIGTHALIQKDVKFARIGIIAIDEQHRFGVRQRANLTQKNTNPDLLYLSATPIPRSLALTVYGDLDVSIIDSLPPGRKPVETFWIHAEDKSKIEVRIRRELDKGRQAYIVCPLVEESEKVDLRDAETAFAEISEKIFPDFRSALLHGKMKNSEKDRIMDDFKQDRVSILVSTTVIEVGVDVANATVMVIEHAERFGLSQLHQLRGRVGRGADVSYCWLVAYPPLSREAGERLQTMVTTNDGFKIAEKDLQLRGPGEFFGTQQSGMPQFRHADVTKDRKILIEARKQAFRIIDLDYKLKMDEHKILAYNYFTKYLSREDLFAH